MDIADLIDSPDRVASGTVIRGTLTAIREDGALEVEADHEAARYVCDTLQLPGGAPHDLKTGQRVLLVPPRDRAERGCVLGVIGKYEPPTEQRTLKIEAEDGLVLKCGAGQISIDAEGAIVIRGTKILSRAKAVNKVKGAAVQIN